MKTYSNLILITLICISIFILFMAVRPTAALPFLPYPRWGRNSHYRIR